MLASVVSSVSGVDDWRAGPLGELEGPLAMGFIAA
jgi:hypothetical protein